MRAEELTAEFGIAGVLDFVETEHGLVKAAILLDDVTAELYLQGAQVTAWQPLDERPVLFTSPKSAFAPGKAIRGGIPIVFPWFGANRHTPTAPPHGFARTVTWHLNGVEAAGSGSLTLTLSLGDGDVGSPFWPEPFRAIYTVTWEYRAVARAWSRKMGRAELGGRLRPAGKPRAIRGMLWVLPLISALAHNR